MSGLNNRLTKAFKDKEYAHAFVDDFLNGYIATQIKVLREQRGLTQKQLAELTGMKQSRISILEDVNYDMWSIATLRKLAEAFDVTLNVSFETFSKRINDIENFSRKSLERTSRMADLSSTSKGKEKVKVKSVASVNQLSLNFDTLADSDSQNILHTPQKTDTTYSKDFYELTFTKAAA